MKVHHIALRSPQPERVRDFYSQIIGLRQVFQQAPRTWWLALDDAQGADPAAAEFPSAVLMIERAEPGEPGPLPGGQDLLAFAVSADQRAALVAQLHQNDVVIEAETGYTSYFRDPDGRRVGISCFDLAAHCREAPSRLALDGARAAEPS